MNLIEIYDENGKVANGINGDLIYCISPRERKGQNCVQIESVGGDFLFYSFETLENFQKRTKDQWVELKCGEKPIKVRPSEIAAYREFDGKIHFWLRGIQDSFLCAESIESFERKLGIKKEEEK